MKIYTENKKVTKNYKNITSNYIRILKLKMIKTNNMTATPTRKTLLIIKKNTRVNFKVIYVEKLTKK